MDKKTIIKQNWLTKKLPEDSFPLTLFLVFLLLLGSYLYQFDLLEGVSWMPATGLAVLKHKEYWRLWTALFAHADLAHILGNLFLFIPFSYFLTRNFSWFFFPIAGFLIGGLINFIVIHNLPERASIVGVSGVVYWMGAAWMTLSFFIDRRSSMGQRFLKVSGVSIVLFFPTTFLPEISYLSHFLGYFFGIISGSFYYFLYRTQFLSAEIVEEIKDIEISFDWENFDLKNILFRPLEQKDFPMLHEWLNRDHIAPNWGGLTSLEEVNSLYQARLHSKSIFPFIVYFNEKPIGFIQAYDASLVRNNWLLETEGTFGIDQFISDKNLLGKGIGSAFIKKFTDEMLLRDEVKRIISDPPPNNPAAIKAYKKAGFHRKARLNTFDGTSILMEKNKALDIWIH